MKQEEKELELLIKDLSGRLPYGVKFQTTWWDDDKEEMTDIVAKLYSLNTDGYCEIYDYDGVVYVEDVKPYLRKMSTMTEEEETIFINKQGYDRYEWLDKNMFDYRGLIPRELALEAPEDMYKYLKFI